MKNVKGPGFYRSVKAKNHHVLAEQMMLRGCHCQVRERVCESIPEEKEEAVVKLQLKFACGSVKHLPPSHWQLLSGFQAEF